MRQCPCANATCQFVLWIKLFTYAGRVQPVVAPHFERSVGSIGCPAVVSACVLNDARPHILARAGAMLRADDDASATVGALGAAAATSAASAADCAASAASFRQSAKLWRLGPHDRIFAFFTNPLL